MTGSSNNSNDGSITLGGPSIGRTVKRLVWECSIPFVIAIAYVWWDSTYGTEFAFATKVKLFGVAFFLLMWFVGQFLRVKKQLHDRDLLIGLGADVQAIKAALAARAAAKGEPPPVAVESSEISDPVAAEMMQQAETALSSSLTLPALLMAMAAFEHSIRFAARRYGIDEGPKVPVRRSLVEIGRRLPSGVAAELTALWDARNKIVHSRDAQIQWSRDAQQLFNSVRWAVTLLSKADPSDWDNVPIAA